MPPGSLFYVWWCTYLHASFSISPTLPPLCPRDMGHILRTKMLDKLTVCVNMEATELGIIEKCWAHGQQGKRKAWARQAWPQWEEGDDHLRSMHIAASFLALWNERFYFLLEKQSFKNQEASGRREQRLSPYTRSHLQTIHEALRDQVREVVKDQSPPIMAPSQVLFS